MKIIKKIVPMLLIIGVILSSTISASAYSYKPETEPESKVVYMVNEDTGEVIYSKNETETVDPAYLTQIMTTIIVLENCEDLDTVITAPRYVFDELYKESGLETADVRAGENISVNDLLYGMMIQSGCECANILADYIGNGDIPAFVNMMNEKAKALGCENTVFASPHGVISKENKTTAKDFYKIYKHALSLPKFEEMAKSIRHTIPANNTHIEARTLVTRAYIIDRYLGGEYYYEYATYAKSSGTGDAGRALVSSATKGEINYTIVSFGAPMYDENDNYIKNIGSFTDHKSLYNWVFNGLKITKVLSKEEMINEIKVTLSKSKDYVHLYPDKDYSVLLPTDVSVDSIQYVKNLPESIKAPVKKGEVVGTMTLRLNNEDIVTVNLVASDDVEADGIILSAYYVGVVLTSPWFWVPVILIAAGFIAFIIYVRVRHNNKRKYKTVKHRRRF